MSRRSRDFYGRRHQNFEDQATRHRRIVGVLVTSSLLAGCVVGPDYQTPRTPLPAKWASNKDKAAERPPELAAWWTRLNDPLLTNYVERAIRNNLTVATAKARVEEARASLRQERGTLFPVANGSFSVNRSQSAGGSGNSGLSNVSTQYLSSIDASWELDLFGGRQRAVEAARYGLDAAAEDLRNTMLVLIGDVALNYSQVRTSQALLALARRTARSQRESASLTRTKYDAGSAANADVARSEALAATTEADVATFEIERAAAVHHLSILLGLPPAALSAELSKGAPIPRPQFPLPVGIPADTLLNRPDLRLAERQLAQATARIGVAEAARYPAISLTGNIATQALSISDLAQKSSIAWTLGPAVTVPLFRAGQLKAAVDVATALRDQATFAYQSAVLTAMADVENAIVSVSRERYRGAKLLIAATAYHRAAESSRAQYREGTTDYLNLLDAQRTLYASEAALIGNQLAIVAAYIALNKALGGGWTGVVWIDSVN